MRHRRGFRWWLGRWWWRRLPEQPTKPARFRWRSRLRLRIGSKPQAAPLRNPPVVVVLELLLPFVWFRSNTSTYQSSFFGGICNQSPAPRASPVAGADPQPAPRCRSCDRGPRTPPQPGIASPPPRPERTDPQPMKLKFLVQIGVDRVACGGSWKSRQNAPHQRANPPMPLPARAGTARLFIAVASRP